MTPATWLAALGSSSFQIVFPFFRDGGTSTRSLPLPERRYFETSLTSQFGILLSPLAGVFYHFLLSSSRFVKRGNCKIDRQLRERASFCNFKSQRLVDSELSRSTRVHRTYCWKALRSRKGNHLKYANFTFSSEFDGANTD